MEPDKTYSNNDYSIVNNGVNISWLNYYNDNRWKCLTVNYRRTKLIEINAVRKIQIVIDALNRFKDISDEELEILYNKALKEQKSDLEIEVEQLKAVKIKAKDEAKKYIEIVEKVKEVFALINNLNKD